MVTPRTEHLLLADWTYDVDEQEFSEIVCELTGYPGWRILPDVAATDRGLLLRRLVIEPADGMPDSGITTRMLRQLRTGDLIAALRAAVAQSEHYFGVKPDLSVSSRAGRRGRGALYYAQWAQAYTEALGRSPHPVDELARRHHLSASQVRNLIYTCRSRGMLTKAPAGRAGGVVTAKAKELLDGVDR